MACQIYEMSERINLPMKLICHINRVALQRLDAAFQAWLLFRIMTMIR